MAIFEGVLNDQDLGCGQDAADTFQPLIDYFASKFLGEDKCADQEQKKFWDTFLNISEKQDDQDKKEGYGRYSSTRSALMEGLEQNKSTHHLMKLRARLDVRIHFVAGKLLLTGDGEPSVLGNKTGGRFLLTSRNCRRQRLHTDYEAGGKRGGQGNPGYFVICTGKDQAYLWVFKRSHIALEDTSHESLRAWSKVLKVEKVVVPPYSMIIVRGDVMHCGASAEDQEGLEKCIRYHYYLVPKQHDLTDNIHLLRPFKPPFHELEEGDGEDENAKDVASSSPRVKARRVKRPNVTEEDDDNIISIDVDQVEGGEESKGEGGGDEGPQEHEGDAHPGEQEDAKMSEKSDSGNSGSSSDSDNSASDEGSDAESD